MNMEKNSFKIIKKKRRVNSHSSGNTAQSGKQAYTENIFTSVDENIAYVRNLLSKDIGLICRKLNTFEEKIEIGILYIDNITDKQLISDQIIEPLVKALSVAINGSEDIIMLLQATVLYSSDSKENDKMKDVIGSIMKGSTVLFIDGSSRAIVIESRKSEKRAIERPSNEVTVFGSMDSLSEDIDTNCNLIIKRLPVSNLRIEKFIIGKLSQTEVKLIWLEGIANSNSIEEAKKRLQEIDVDFIDNTGNLGELIEQNRIVVLKTSKQSQRPDTISKYLSEGHFVIFCNHCPYGLIAPITFWDNFKTMDDYAENPLSASYLRIVRYLGFIFGTLVSALYLSFVAYNHYIVPPSLSANIALGRDGVPFPSIVEILGMSLVITLIREAALRIPGSIGYFIGALAAIVIGQSAVSAGYVSASVIIVVAVSTISCYSVSSNDLLCVIRMIDYFLIILSGIFGMFGIINGAVLIVWYMTSLESFGVPYLYPLIPFDLEAIKDTIIRAPAKMIKKRLRMLAPFNQIRIGNKDK